MDGWMEWIALRLLTVRAPPVLKKRFNLTVGAINASYIVQMVTILDQSWINQFQVEVQSLITGWHSTKLIICKFS